MVSLQRIQSYPLMFGARQKTTAQSKSDQVQALLASNVDFSKLRFPVYISPKIDGNRGLIRNGVVIGRSTLAIPNPNVQKALGNQPLLEGLDGELVVGPPTADDACSKTSGYMSRKKPTHSDFTFQVFDLWNRPGVPFEERLAELQQRVKALPRSLSKFVKLVPQKLVTTEKAILAQEKKWLAQGYEGLIIRGPKALYSVANKENRSNMDDQGLLKLKRFVDAEAVILAFRKLEADSALVKSFQKAGELTAAGVRKIQQGVEAMAGYVVKDVKSGVEFNLGAGNMAFEQRLTLWKNRAHLLGKVVKYKYFPKGINLETKKPRHPGFLGFREAHDMPADLKQIAEAIAQSATGQTDSDD